MRGMRVADALNERKKKEMETKKKTKKIEENGRRYEIEMGI